MAAYDERLADRVRRLLAHRAGYSERRMFGGICFMLYGNMACGVLADTLIVRVPRDRTEAVLRRKYTRPFDFTGKAMRGFVVVEAAGTRLSQALSDWVNAACSCAGKLPHK